jgi:uncharacterized repeat protein (TIGR03803 family)
MRIYRFFTFLVPVLITIAAHAQSFSVVYNFGSASGDPTNPSFSGIVARGRDGNLYTTAPQGGSMGDGAVIKISGTLNVLYSFDGIHGSDPEGGLTLATDGNFYGTTCSGGTSGSGTVFKITPSGSLTVLHNFTGGGDGQCPYAPPIQGTDGNFYGTTYGGGAGYGVVYKMTSSGALTPLYKFDLTHGLQPFAPLVQGTDGNFYGTTASGGNNGSDAGVIFRITPAGKLTVLYNFDGGTHGGLPFGPLVQGSDGNFYGTTLSSTGPTGVVFKITPAGTLTVLHTMNGTTDGEFPYAGLVQATDGNFYGVNSGGGSPGAGTIFKISSKGSYSVLYNFDGTTGSTPDVTPFQHTNGVVYGDTRSGGAGNVTCTAGTCGVFYSLSASLPPFVSLLPYSGKVGKTIEILGQGFTSTTTVSFNGTAATPTVKSGAYLMAVVPNGATTGFVRVTTSSGTLTSNKKFRVTPQITGFSPTSGAVGTVVTITGVSLKQSTNVTFGGVKATTFTVDSDTLATATVPTGAVTGKIALTTPGGTAVSSRSFTVPSSSTLTGYCLQGGLACSADDDATACPPGAAVINPGTVRCGFPPIELVSTSQGIVKLAAPATVNGQSSSIRPSEPVRIRNTVAFQRRVFSVAGFVRGYAPAY